jgi:hypothetical protein
MKKLMSLLKERGHYSEIRLFIYMSLISHVACSLALLPFIM